MFDAGKEEERPWMKIQTRSNKTDPDCKFVPANLEKHKKDFYYQVLAGDLRHQIRLLGTSIRISRPDSHRPGSRSSGGIRVTGTTRSSHAPGGAAPRPIEQLDPSAPSNPASQGPKKDPQWGAGSDRLVLWDGIWVDRYDARQELDAVTLASVASHSPFRDEWQDIVESGKGLIMENDKEEADANFERYRSIVLHHAHNKEGPVTEREIIQAVDGSISTAIDKFNLISAERGGKTYEKPAPRPSGSGRAATYKIPEEDSGTDEDAPQPPVPKSKRPGHPTAEQLDDLGLKFGSRFFSILNDIAIFENTHERRLMRSSLKGVRFADERESKKQIKGAKKAYRREWRRIKGATIVMSDSESESEPSRPPSPAPDRHLTEEQRENERYWRERDRDRFETSRDYGRGRDRDRERDRARDRSWERDRRRERERGSVRPREPAIEYITTFGDEDEERAKKEALKEKIVEDELRALLPPKPIPKAPKPGAKKVNLARMAREREKEAQRKRESESQAAKEPNTESMGIAKARPKDTAVNKRKPFRMGM